MSKIVIKNRAEIVEKLAEILHQFDVKHTNYQEDVYMYVDDNGNAKLDTFVNVGGNSWLDDNHYTLYRKHEWCFGKINPEEMFSTIEDFADYLELTKDELIKAAADYFEEDDLDYIGYTEVCRYLVETSGNELEQAWKDMCDDLTGVYMENAEQILEQFEEEMENY